MGREYKHKRYSLASALHMIQKHLRENMGVDIDIILFRSIGRYKPHKVKRSYEFKITIMGESQPHTSSKRYVSYEVALIAGIKETLALLENEDNEYKVIVSSGDGLSYMVEALELLEGTI